MRMGHLKGQEYCSVFSDFLPLKIYYSDNDFFHDNLGKFNECGIQFNNLFQKTFLKIQLLGSEINVP